METLVTLKVSIVLSPVMEIKERISLKAEEMFMQFGIRSVSMDDIATQLGMSKKTIYQYFTDKDELVELVVENHIDKIEQDCGQCHQGASNAIHEIFNTMEQILEEMRSMNPMLLFDLEKFHHKAYKRFRNYKEKFLLETIRKNIQWGKDEGLYRDELDVDIMSKYRIESMMIPFNLTVFPLGKYNLAETSQMIIENFTYGLASIKGHKLIQKYNEQRQKKSQNEEAVK